MTFATASTSVPRERLSEETTTSTSPLRNASSILLDKRNFLVKLTEFLIITNEMWLIKKIVIGKMQKTMYQPNSGSNHNDRKRKGKKTNFTAWWFDFSRRFTTNPCINWLFQETLYQGHLLGTQDWMVIKCAKRVGDGYEN